MALFLSLFLFTLTYRILLTASLFSESVKPFDFNPSLNGKWFMARYVPYDLIFIISLSIIPFILSRPRPFIQDQTYKRIKLLGLILLQPILLMVALIYGVHFRLIFAVQTGLNYSILQEVFTNVSCAGLLPFIDLQDCLLLLIPIILFWLILKNSCIRIWFGKISTLILMLILLLSLYEMNTRHVIADEIKANPVLFLLSDIASTQDLSKEQIAGSNNKEWTGLQPASLLYHKPIKPVKLTPLYTQQKWNVVFFIMESVGTRYISDTSQGNSMPMPFLLNLTKKGWFLKDHYTTSNISSRAVFSMLSGLYDYFKKETFSTQSDASVPSIYNLLGKEYDGFLVTPSSIYWYFPTAFLKNSGIEMHHFENMPFKVHEAFKPEGHYIARNELDTLNFFIARVKRAREPFIGIYISFAGHYPYFDYGEQYRIMPDNNRLINRYFNNLNFLDHMLKLIYENLQHQGLLERTILVIVGDHGQAFGQHHQNNFMHFRYTYSENIQTPAILYQPRLFKPKVIAYPTSHVDILPTILDAMRIPYDPFLLQGESLYNSRMRRKYIFCYGQAGSILSISATHLKVQYSLREKSCRAYDLQQDPYEEKPHNCSPFQEQFEALRKFVDYHNRSLLSYNTSIKRRSDFNGHRHPLQ
jgi:hypothetical protein